MDTAAQEAEIVIDRVFDAPLQLVWEAWSDPKHAQQWCAPHGCTNPVYEHDVRTGGTLRSHMLTPDGSLFHEEGVYEEVSRHTALRGIAQSRSATRRSSKRA